MAPGMVLDGMPLSHDHFRLMGILLHLAADNEKLGFYVITVQRLENKFKVSYRRGPVIERQHDHFAITQFAITPFVITPSVITPSVITPFEIIPFGIIPFGIIPFRIMPFVIIAHVSPTQKKSTINAT
jgi:hypothetical protein